METLKELPKITEPDTRSTAFVKFNSSTGTTEPITLEDNYRYVEYVQLTESVPEDVRSYMEAVKTLFVYGWFYYPFYTLSVLLATTAVEMALRARFPKKGPDFRGLGRLFRRAINEGILRDENFPSLKHVQANRPIIFPETEQSQIGAASQPEQSYAERVANGLIHFRNEFAHPHAHWILPPGPAFDFLVLAGEVINQLWPVESQGSVNVP
jgi:hypothetical protein